VFEEAIGNNSHSSSLELSTMANFFYATYYSLYGFTLAPNRFRVLNLNIQGSVLMYAVPPVRPGYIGKRRTTFAKAYGLKVRCLYGEHAGEHIGNPLGT